jgi:hypothetical protein
MALKIIGAGLGRTGTASLKVALEQLGMGACYHMTEVLQDPPRGKAWIEAAKGNADWDTIFDGFGGSVDYPGCTFWEELADYYPDAKIILTTRDPVRWWESSNETIMSEMLVEGIKGSPFGELMQRIVFDTVDNRMRDKDFMVSYFEKRNAEIIEKVPADRLLVYQVKEGWAPLYEFLGVPVPAGEFPRINSREETKALISGMLSQKGGLSEDAMSAAGKSLHGD